MTEKASINIAIRFILHSKYDVLGAKRWGQMGKERHKKIPLFGAETQLHNTLLPVMGGEDRNPIIPLQNEFQIPNTIFRYAQKKLFTVHQGRLLAEKNKSPFLLGLCFRYWCRQHEEKTKEIED
ncbi:MAG: hypothetical protein P8130_02690 [Deltaproteobacteria bacterium]